jgi:hypothetical protein
MARAVDVRLYTSDLSFFDSYLQRFVDEAAAGYPQAVARMRRVPRLAGLDASRMAEADLTLDDARQATAAEHGFDDWDELARYATDVAAGRREDRFPAFIHHVEGGDVDAVSAHLDAEADLVSGIASTFKSALHSAGSAQVARRLLEHGAPPNLETGESGSTALVHHLIWGKVEEAEAVAEVSLAPANLRVAAGLGRFDLLTELVDDAGALRAGAGLKREYYRPNLGWYAWQPGDSAQEILDEALIFAATNGRIEMASRLVDYGADVNGLAYETRPLHRAAWRDQAEMVRWLVEAGADVHATGWLGGHMQGATPLHMAATGGSLAAARVLIEAGADLTIREPLYDATAEGHAMHQGHDEVAAELKAARGAS